MSTSDNDQPEFEPSKSMHIAREGENSNNRPPEVKAARKDFVDATNDFLHRIHDLQARGAMIEFGGVHYPIESESRVREKHLGRSALGFNQVQNQNVGGISLVGDGETSPFVFNAVFRGLNGSSRVIEITGTNPMLPLDEHGNPGYSGGFTEEVVEAKFTSTIVSGPDSVEQQAVRYSVSADGSMGSPATTGVGGTQEMARLRLEGMQEAALMIHGLADELRIPPPPTNPNLPYRV
jgi:hypothetical protein